MCCIRVVIRALHTIVCVCVCGGGCGKGLWCVVLEWVIMALHAL